MTTYAGPSLDVDRITSALRGLPIGNELRYLPNVDSTNRVIRQLPGGEVHHGLTLLAEYQELGRGRRGRGWNAPARSSVLLSLALLPPPGTPPGDLVMVASLSVVDAISGVTGLQTDLKWPNDVLSSGRKLCGILAERTPLGEYVIVGIGVNCNFDPSECSDIPPSATSLLSELGAEIDRTELVIALCTSMNMWYRKLTHEPGSVFEEWAKRLAIAGKPLEVHDNSGRWQGVAIELLRDGALLVGDSGGKIHRLYAADVSIRLPGICPGDET